MPCDSTIQVGCSPVISVCPLSVNVPDISLSEYILPSVAVAKITAPASVTSVNVWPEGSVTIAEPTVVSPSYWCIAFPILTSKTPFIENILS